MMVIEHRKDLIKNGMIDLPYSNVDAEERMYYVKDQAVDDMAYRRTDSSLVLESIWRGIGGLLIRRHRKVWLEQSLAVLRRQWPAMFVDICVESLRPARANHFAGLVRQWMRNAVKPAN